MHCSSSISVLSPPPSSILFLKVAVHINFLSPALCLPCDSDHARTASFALVLSMAVCIFFHSSAPFSGAEWHDYVSLWSVNIELGE